MHEAGKKPHKGARKNFAPQIDLRGSFSVMRWGSRLAGFSEHRIFAVVMPPLGNDILHDIVAAVCHGRTPAIGGGRHHRPKARHVAHVYDHVPFPPRNNDVAGESVVIASDRRCDVDPPVLRVGQILVLSSRPGIGIILVPTAVSHQHQDEDATVIAGLVVIAHE